MSTPACVCVYVCVYVNNLRESKGGTEERGENEMHIYMYVHTHTHTYTYIVGDTGQVFGALLYEGRDEVLGNAAEAKPTHTQLAPVLDVFDGVGGVVVNLGVCVCMCVCVYMSERRERERERHRQDSCWRRFMGNTHTHSLTHIHEILPDAHTYTKTYLVGQTTLQDRGGSSRATTGAMCQLVGKAQHD